jgi:hypothetical protein
MRVPYWLSFLSSRRRAGPARPAAAHRRARPFRPTVEALEDRFVPSFSPAAVYAVGTSPQAVLTADFNSDRQLDLAVANYSSNTVSVLLGNADGTFQSAQDSATGASPQSLAVGDFNADGKLDLATANAGDVSVLLGTGNGTFQAPTNIGIGSDPVSVAVGDFNADGKLDLGVASNVYFPPCCFGIDPYTGYMVGNAGYYEGRANVLLGTGTGSFAVPNTTVFGTGYGYHMMGAAVADLNGDGKQDFASANNYSGSVIVQPGTGTGTLGAPVSFSVGSWNAPESVAAGDVNADGKLDLVTVNRSSDSVSVLLGTGTGSFGVATTYAAGSQPRSVAMADFNGDGKIDLATANGDAGTVSVLLGTGAGAFKPPVNAPARSYPLRSYPLAVAVGDFSGDGRPDVAAADSNSGNVSVLLNDGTWPALGAPSITINDVTVTEGNTGTTAATFTVTLSAAYGQPVSVHYATADDSATVAGGDYQAASGTLTFNPGGPLTRTITVPVNGDRQGEDRESFLLVLTEPTNAFVADAKGVGTILDDEPYLSIGDMAATAVEGNSGTTAMTFTVTLSAASDAPVTVDYGTADEYGWGFARAGEDYQPASGTVTFAPGETSKTFTVSVIGDRVAESDEEFSVTLGNPTGGVITNGWGLGTILDDEPRFNIGYTTVTEGNTGTVNATVTVTLSAAYDQEVRVDYATVNGTATEGTDYRATTGTLTFAPGQTTATITVPVYGDRVAEGDEYFYVQLSNPTPNAHDPGNWGSGTIVDDEPRVSVNNVALKEGNSGVTYYTFTVSLSAAYDQPVTVNYATQNGSAKSGSDYQATSGRLTFAPGETTKTVTVAVYGDTTTESDEYFYLVLSDPSGNALVGNGWGTGWIQNDDVTGSKGGGRKK